MLPEKNNGVVDRESSCASSPRVSVVVPSYNHSPFVGMSLRSIMKQTLLPSELIVIDDGSIDGSPQIIEQVLKECSFPCELIVRSNKGLCATLNEGLQRSREKYFAYLGSDDAWLPDFLRARVELLESRPNAVLGYGHAYIIDEQHRIVECTLDWGRYIDGNVQQMLLRTTAPLSSTVLYRRKALERYGWNEKAKLEDYELYLRLSADGDFAFDPRVLSVWRQHGYNTSQNLTFMIDECLAAQRRVAAVSKHELKHFHAAIKWRYAEDFVRQGRKVKALKLVCRNFRGAPSVNSIARMVIRLFEPRFLMKWRRSFYHRRTSERYGTIQI